MEGVFGHCVEVNPARVSERGRRVPVVAVISFNPVSPWRTRSASKATADSCALPHAINTGAAGAPPAAGAPGAGAAGVAQWILENRCFGLP